MSVHRESAAQSAYRVLRDAIISGHLAPRARLAEAELASGLSVSRTPLREALRILEADGFAERLPSGGLVVAGIDQADAADLYAVRGVLEAFVAREAARRASDAEIADLEALVGQMERLSDYPEEILRLGPVFHDRVAEIARSRRALELMRQLRHHIERYRAITTLSQPGRPEAAVAEHRLIFEAIRRHDPEAAERAIHLHTTSGAAVFVRPDGRDGTPAAPEATAIATTGPSDGGDGEAPAALPFEPPAALPFEPPATLPFEPPAP